MDKSCCIPLVELFHNGIEPGIAEVHSIIVGVKSDAFELQVVEAVLCCVLLDQNQCLEISYHTLISSNELSISRRGRIPKAPNCFGYCWVHFDI